MQQSLQREVAEAVGFTLASVAFIMKVDSLVLRPQRGQETPPAEQPTEDTEKTEEQIVHTLPRRRSGRTRAQVTPRPESQHRGGHPPPRARGHPHSSTLT
jgi:hypothetical protein